MLIRGGEITLRKCAFISNVAIDDCAGIGGAVALHAVTSATLKDCYFEANRAEADVSMGTCGATAHGKGGGLYAAGSTVSIERCAFAENRAFGYVLAGGTGGGAAIFGGSVDIRDSHFLKNRADSGAGATLDGVEGSLVGVEFEENAAVPDIDIAFGGGLSIARSAVAIGNCAFLRNSVADANPVWGGGLAARSSVLDVMNTVFVGNRATNVCFEDSAVGGAISVQGGCEVRLDHVTVTSGLACAGSGIHAFGATRAPTALEIHNSIIHGNERDQVFAQGDGLTLSIEYSLVQGGWSGAGNIDGDPRFADPAGGDLALLAGSPAIDAGSVSRLPPDSLDLDGDGDTAEPLPIDILGAQRRLDDPAAPDTGEGPAPLPDMGAYERDAGCPADCDGDGDLTFFDFLCFQDRFAAGDPKADCDGDGDLTFFDFLCFQNAFAAGCP